MELVGLSIPPLSGKRRELNLNVVRITLLTEGQQIFETIYPETCHR